MTDLFKNAFSYIIEEMTCVMVKILKYAPWVQGVDEAGRIRPRCLTFVLDQAACRRRWGLKHFTVDLKGQGICEWVVYKNPWILEYVPDHFKTREMCDDMVMEDPLLLRHVSDWFLMQQQLRQCDDYYDDNGYIKWHKGYKKRKAQKASIREELLPIAWHPSRYWDWCMSEDKKSDAKNCGDKYRPFLCLMTGYKKSFDLKELKIKMPSVLSVSNESSKSEEFSPKDIENFLDNEDQNWIKRTHVRNFLGLEIIRKLLNRLEKCGILTKQELIPTRRGTAGWSGPKDQQNKTDKFLSFFGVKYVIVNSREDKGKTLKEHILNNIVPRGLDVRIEEIQGQHQQAIKEKDAVIALMNNDL